MTDKIDKPSTVSGGYRPGQRMQRYVDLLGLGLALVQHPAHPRLDETQPRSMHDCSPPDITAHSAAVAPRIACWRRHLLAVCFALVGVSNVSAADQNYYVERRSYGTTREPDPPRYVRRLDQAGGPAYASYDWLDLGLDHRSRFEYRDNDFRRTRDVIDTPLLLRTRAYVGVHDRFDPFRFHIEMADSRAYHGEFPRDDRDFNEFEFIQAAAELYFADALGQARPLRVQAGRLAFEYLDRRLLARNEWRNTANTFQGVRVILGQESNDWQVDLLALQPQQRLLSDQDRPSPGEHVFGVIGNWRRWSRWITLQPYYLMLEQNARNGRAPRHIHAPALRAYSVLGDSGFDFDMDLMVQRGESAGQTHRALGFTFEAGYTARLPWKPRFSAFYGYASGDDSPTDNRSGRFERFFGFARPWSNNDYFQWENLHAPKTHIEFQPIETLRIDTGLNGYWLASETDRWNNGKLRDPSGASGTFIGSEIDLRIRYKVLPRVEGIFGYTFFRPGGFTRRTGRDDNSHFFYVELDLTAFR